MSQQEDADSLPADAIWSVLHRMGFKIVVNSYVPADTIIVHASTIECLKVWNENQVTLGHMPKPAEEEGV